MLACRNCLILCTRYLKRYAGDSWRRLVNHHKHSLNWNIANSNQCRFLVTSCRFNVSKSPPSSETDQSDSNASKNCQSESDQEDTYQSEDTIDDVRKKILEHALDHVTEHGWSRKAISLGAENAGYDGVAEGMFEETDLVLYFVRESNQKLLRHLQENANEYKDHKSRLIRDAIEFRLRLIIPYISVWPEAMKMLLNPRCFDQSWNELGHMVDDVWHHAGDKSADFNWYTKRAMLAKLYTTTQLYMLNDQSPDFADTWEFLDRRLVSTVA